MRFPAKKSAGCPKAPRDFPSRKDGILLGVGGGEIEKRPETEKRCSHNLQSALLGQRRFWAGALFAR